MKKFIKSELIDAALWINDNFVLILGYSIAAVPIAGIIYIICFSNMPL